jgi:uncharacterized protein
LTADKKVSLTMLRKRKSVKSIIERKFRSPADNGHSRKVTPKKVLVNEKAIKVVVPTKSSPPAQVSSKPSAVKQVPPPVVDYHPQTKPVPARQIQNIPWNYGDNIIYLLIRDPYWIYSYWEIQKDHEQKALDSLASDWGSVKSVLRVYDVTDTEKNPPFFDIALQSMADHWFINVGAHRCYYVEIGLLHRDGRFVMLARSNRVKTPRDGMSDVLDEHWMSVDFDKLYALSGGFELGKSSMELKKLMQERLQKAVTSGSGAISSFGSPVKVQKKGRGFWFVLDCELIVYGATEPDAKVTMQGKEIKLRPDGTFSLRYALPDGKIVLDAVAESADGVEVRKIIPVVERNTTVPAPLILKEQP